MDFFCGNFCTLVGVEKNSGTSHGFNQHIISDFCWQEFETVSSK
jgi:hypothetical protein